MKKGLYGVFRCDLCGAVFEEKLEDNHLFDDETGEFYRVSDLEYAKHIGVKRSVLCSTHHCTPGEGVKRDTYGCGRLIGCRLYEGD